MTRSTTAADLLASTRTDGSLAMDSHHYEPITAESTLLASESRTCLAKECGEASGRMIRLVSAEFGRRERT